MLDCYYHSKEADQKTIKNLLIIDNAMFEKNPQKFIKEKEKQMNAAVKELDFETAAILRDEIQALMKQLGTAVGSFSPRLLSPAGSANGGQAKKKR